MPRTGPAQPHSSRLLFDQDAIQQAVRRLGQEIGTVYGQTELTIVSVLHGAMIFTSDLIRELEMPLQLETVTARSYRDEATTPGDLQVRIDRPEALASRHVLIVDDILDTGRTLSRVRADIAGLGPTDIRCAVLLDKPSRRITGIEADFVGLAIPDVFVVGYGLDWNGHYRNLPDILALTTGDGDESAGAGRAAGVSSA